VGYQKPNGAWWLFYSALGDVALLEASGCGLLSLGSVYTERLYLTSQVQIVRFPCEELCCVRCKVYKSFYFR